MSPICEVIGSIDQGTQSSRVSFYDSDLHLLARTQRTHKQYNSEPGWIEQDPMEIFRNVQDLAKEAVAALRRRVGDDTEIKFRGIGISNQRETTIAWDKDTGKPLYPAIVWMDSRTKDIAKSIAEEHGGVDAFRSVTGLPVATYFSACKARWLIENISDVKEGLSKGTCLIGTVDSWLIWNLTRTEGRKDDALFITDVTNASRTLLMDIETCQWSPKLLDIFGLPPASLATIKSSAEIYGHIKNSGCPELDGVAISGCAGDQQAACIGQGLFARGRVKSTFGTGGFVLLNTGEERVASTSGLLTTPCYKLGPDAPVHYALEGSIAVAGAAITWLKDTMKTFDKPEDTEVLLETVEDSEGVYFVPAFSGLFAPRWRQDAKACILGLTLRTKREHVIRALFEAFGFQMREILSAMQKDAGFTSIDSVRLDGAVSKNDAFLQLLADLSGCRIERPIDAEVTSLGAAIAAGIGCGFFDSLEAVETHLCTSCTRWKPRWDAEKREQKAAQWDKAVERCLDWP